MLLPEIFARSMTDHPYPAPPAVDGAPQSHVARTVLLVDDEAGVRRAAGRLLERSGYRVVVAGDGAEAVDRLEELAGQVDVVVTDMIMPRMDARDLVATIRSRWPSIPVVLSTGYDAGRLGDDGKALFDGFAPKPYLPAELLAAVRACLEGRS
jgi:CheY-like chemotaxis protein